MRIAKAPASWFMPIEYDDFMEWKMNGWDIPDHTIASYVQLTVRLVKSRSSCINNINQLEKGR